MTTSPNVLVYAAMDGCRRQMVQGGSGLLGAALALAGGVREELTQMPGLHVLEDELIHAEGSHDMVLPDPADPTLATLRVTVASRSR